MPELIFYPPKIKSVQSVALGNGHAFTPTNQRQYKKLIRLQAMQQLSGFEPIVGCVKTEFLFYFQRPLSHYVNNDCSRPLKAGAPTRSMKTPDITDNACKGIADALTGFAWIDDKQITDHCAKKQWSTEPDHIILKFEGVEE